MLVWNCTLQEFERNDDFWCETWSMASTREFAIGFGLESERERLNWLF